MESIGDTLKAEIIRVHAQLERRGKLRKVEWTRNATKIAADLHATALEFEDGAIIGETFGWELRRLRLALGEALHALTGLDTATYDAAELRGAFDRLRAIATDTRDVPFLPYGALPRVLVSFAPELDRPFTASLADGLSCGEGRTRDEALVRLARTLTGESATVLPEVVRGDAERTLSLLRALAEATDFA